MNFKQSFAILTAAFGIGGISCCDRHDQGSEPSGAKEDNVYQLADNGAFGFDFDVKDFLFFDDGDAEKCKDKTAEITYLNSQNFSRKILSLWLGDYLNDDYKLSLMSKDHRETYQDRIQYYNALFSCDGGNKDLSIRAQNLLDNPGDENAFVGIAADVMQNHREDIKEMFDREYLLDRAEAFFVFYMGKVDEEFGAGKFPLSFDDIKSDLSKSIDLNYGQIVGGEMVRDLMFVFDTHIDKKMTVVEDVVEKLCFYYLADKIIEQQNRLEERRNFNRKNGIYEASTQEERDGYDFG